MRDAKKVVAAAVVALVFFGLGLNRAAAEGWDGPYVGANLGMGFDSFNMDDVNYFTSYDRRVQSSNSFMPGLKAGYNRRFGNAVVGGEFELDGNFGAHTHQLAFTTGGKSDTYTGDLNSLLALRGRAGLLAAEHGLVYLTLGAVYAKSVQEFHWASNPPNDGIWRWDGWNWGLLTGVGMEFELTNSVTLTSEYLRGFFIPSYVTGAGTGSGGPANFHFAFSPSLDVVRVGMNYRFGR
jgi:opacity protein-like surface antigen